jgi:hypothetical protein
MSNNDTPFLDCTIFLKSSDYTSKIAESNLIFDLNQPIIVPPNVDILMKLDNFQFTNSFYTINPNNQYFYYTISGGVMQTITITNGFYNIDDIVVLLNSYANGVLVFSWDFYKYTITITSSSSFIINSGPNNVYNILGFDNFGTLNYSTSFTGPYLFNTMNIQVLKVCIANINIQSIGKKNDKRNNILYALRVNVGAGEIQNFFNTNDFMYKLQENIISTLNIQILDQYDNFVLFNGIEFFMSINISFQYKKQLIPAHYLTSNYKTIDDYENTAIDTIEEEQKQNLNRVLDEIIYRNNLLKRYKKISN